MTGALAGRTLNVSLVGLTTIHNLDEHHVQVSLNGTLLGDVQWSGMVRQPDSHPFTIPDGVLKPGANQVEIKAILDPGIPYSLVAVDSVDVTYARSATVVDDRLLLTAGSRGPVLVDGLTSADAWVFDVTSPAAPVKMQTTADTGAGGDSWVLFEAKAGGRYLVTTPAEALRPDAMTGAPKVKFETSPGKGAEYVVITSAELAVSAANLADYRAGQRMKTMVVTTQQIYDAFNYGLADPQGDQGLHRVRLEEDAAKSQVHRSGR